MWDNVFPSFLIGLREGLEAGLVVSVLVATLVRSDQRARLPHVWTGVLAAIGVSMAFGAVLTFTSANLPGKAQEAFGGFLSLIAVVFVTAMVFWMRRSARSFSGQLKEKVAAALQMGAGVLVVTSFLAVGREGLETALFLWTTAQAAGESAGPLIGAAIGLVLAAGLCWGLYRRVLKLNLTRFFTITGSILIVIAAGVLAYGFRDLQESGLLPGGDSFAFDLPIDAGTWYATLVQGTLNLQPRMTWLQVIAYVGYAVITMTVFLRQTGTTAPAASASEDKPRRVPAWSVPLAVVAVPAVIAAMVIAVSGKKTENVAAAVQVSAQNCGKGFTTPKPGRQVFQVRNTGDRTAEVYLIDPASNAVYGEVEGIAPGTTRSLVATIGTGSYAWRCVPNGGGSVTSAAVRVSGGSAGTAVIPLAEKELEQPLAAYKAYVDKGLAALEEDTSRLHADLADGDVKKAKKDWLTAHLRYASLGAAYGTFADFDGKINGRTAGLPGGVEDKDFTGFHRLEYGLWHDESASSLAKIAKQLADDVTALREDFPKQDFDAGDLALRTHEILENTLHQDLTGSTDYGSGSTLATAKANLDGTQVLLDLLRPLIDARNPKVTPAVDTWMKRTAELLRDPKPLDSLSPAERQKLNGTVSQLLEELAPIPDLLEIRKAG
ncbi:iron uptake transporter permease EfeU [Nonomuraea sediminis]|uniref:iron uptake transporter permease EfeU n=1 Tax=Nonomuraea sediminis TaxID=2835864 RepID=UPI001BDD7532|nr:iron uptake transporter permease EfeU [Nonomuraea sediminis]